MDKDQVVLVARLSPDLLCRDLVGEAVLLDLKARHYYGLDEVGARILQLLRERGRTDLVLEAMLDEFDVDRAQLQQDLAVFLSELEDAGLVELSRPETDAATGA